MKSSQIYLFKKKKPKKTKNDNISTVNERCELIQAIDRKWSYVEKKKKL